LDIFRYFNVAVVTTGSSPSTLIVFFSQEPISVPVHRGVGRFSLRQAQPASPLTIHHCTKPIHRNRSTSTHIDDETDQGAPQMSTGRGSVEEASQLVVIQDHRIKGHFVAATTQTSHSTSLPRI
jgi:hypothetical protein